MANSTASGSSTGKVALTRSVKVFMARRVAGVHTPLSSPFIAADPAQLLLQLARDVGILWDRRRPRSRRIRWNAARERSSGDAAPALTCTAEGALPLPKPDCAPWAVIAEPTESEDESAGFSAGELHARPTGTWHWLVARFPRCRGGSGWWVCGSRSCLLLLRRPRRLRHAPETDVTGLYPLVVTPICASSMKAPDTGLQNGLGPSTFLTELSFSLQPTSSLGPSTPVRR
jgi:hypothetical protein